MMWFNPSLTAPAFPKDDLLFQEMKQDGQGIREKKIDGKKVILAYEQIPNTGVFVAYIAELAVLYRGTYRIRNLCILVLLLIVVACFIISYYVTCSISEPVSQLVRVMKRPGTANGTRGMRTPVTMRSPYWETGSMRWRTRRTS